MLSRRTGREGNVEFCKLSHGSRLSQNMYIAYDYTLQLMVLPWDTRRLSEFLILDRSLDHHTVTQFTRSLSEDLLPRRLTLWYLVGTHLLLSGLDLFSR